jgi:hypothetical protein
MEAEMIRPLRRAHRIIAFAWWLLLPLLAVAMWRQP